MVPRRRNPRVTRFARLLAVTAYLLVGLLGWQGAVVEVFEPHAGEAAEECPDDERGACDCGPNCHCCFKCAHQSVPVLPALGAETAPERVLSSAELPAPRTGHTPESVDRGPPLKVPKHLG